LVIFQHIVGGLGILATAFYLRVMLGARALWPAIACGVALALYGKLLYMEHLIRNDIYLFFLAAVALIAWGLSLRSMAMAWLFVCGLAAALGAITRNMLAPLPLLILLGLAWQCRKEIKTVIVPAAIFILGFAIPYVGAKVFRQLTVHDRPPLSQPAQNFFARVAQFTVLDGGIEPEIKALIREDIEKYRAREDLDNNEILNQTAVPRIRAHYESQGKTLADGDRLFWRLALEAVSAHPKEYLAQCRSEFLQVQLEMGVPESEPTAGDVRGSVRALSNSENPWPQLRIAETTKLLEPALKKEHLRDYRRFNEHAWLFAGMPVLFTSIGVTLLALFWRGNLKPWWLTSAVIWWYMMILLCTIGRPLGRYLLPVMPIMFWTLGSFVALAWMGLTLLLERLFQQKSRAI
jgi:hypothetical protein